MKAATHICVGITNDTWREWFKEGDGISINKTGSLWHKEMINHCHFSAPFKELLGYPFPETPEEIEIFYMLYPNIRIPTEEMIREEDVCMKEFQ